MGVVVMLKKITSSRIVQAAAIYLFFLLLNKIAPSLLEKIFSLILLAVFFYLAKGLFCAVKEKSKEPFKKNAQISFKLFCVSFLVFLASDTLNPENQQPQAVSSSSVAQTSAKKEALQNVAKKEAAPVEEKIEQSRTSKRISNKTGMAPKAANSLESIIEKSKFEDWEIKRYQDLDGYKDVLDNKAYLIEEKHLKRIIVYVNKDTVVAVRFEGYPIYENGKQNYTKDDFYMSNDQAERLMFWCEDTIKKSIPTPTTADFPYHYKWYKSKSPKQIEISSYVDYENIYGAKIRSKFTFEFSPDGKKVKSIVVDGEKLTI